MWLLHTKELSLHDSSQIDVPKYAILSHTWGEKEISFKDVQKIGLGSFRECEKIRQFCARAYSDGYLYAWVDTCCIDKRSSAELSEAINSMYRWYQESGACYVYLSDVLNIDRHTISLDQLRKSRWFYRGWTLQELLASKDPISVKFYNREWTFLGDRNSLSSHISDITGIDQIFILGHRHIHSASVAVRMSWASNRRTTRLEDEAYCLLGIFNVNMPLLYGENEKAFLRLQQEIVNSSCDESLFAWHSTVDMSGMFAPRPSAFRGCGDIYRDELTTYGPEETYTVTNRCFRLPNARCRTIPFECLDGHRCFYDPDDAREFLYILFPLRCSRIGTEGRPYTIILRSISSGSTNIFLRLLPGENMVCEKYFDKTTDEYKGTIFIDDRFMPPEGSLLKKYPVIISLKEAGMGGYKVIKLHICPPGQIDNNRIMSFNGWTGFAVLQLGHTEHDLTCIIIIIKFLFTTHGVRGITMDLASSKTSVDEAVRACYAQKNLLGSIPDGCGNTSVRTVDGTEVRLEQDEGASQDYDLSISQPQKVLKSLL